MSNMCVHVVVPASNFVSVWVSAQIRREPHLPALCENIKIVCSVPASYCFKRPFTGRTKLEKRNIIWFLQSKHLTQLTDIFLLLLLVSCNFCFKKVSLMTGFTVFEPGSFKAYPRLVCFLWRAMFSELFVCATSHWREINCVLILQILLHLLDSMFLWGLEEGAKESEANKSAVMVWFYWREGHACQLSPGLISGILAVVGLV